MEGQAGRLRGENAHETASCGLLHGGTYQFRAARLSRRRAWTSSPAAGGITIRSIPKQAIRFDPGRNFFWKPQAAAARAPHNGSQGSRVMSKRPIQSAHVVKTKGPYVQGVEVTNAKLIFHPGRCRPGRQWHDRWQGRHQSTDAAMHREHTPYHRGSRRFTCGPRQGHSLYSRYGKLRRHERDTP